MKRRGPHSAARYHATAALYRKHGSISAVMTITGLSREAIGRDLYQARTRGVLPRPADQDAHRWATETARISALTVGSRGDLFNALGVGLVKRIAAECPQGVPLMVYIAGIVKDAYDESV